MDEIHTLRVLRISSGRRNRRERIEQPVCREKYQMASAASVETREPVKIRSHTHRIDSDTLTPAGREAGMCDAPIRYTVYEACSWPAAAPWGPWLSRTQAGDKSIVDCRHARTEAEGRACAWVPSLDDGLYEAWAGDACGPRSCPLSRARKEWCYVGDRRTRRTSRGRIISHVAALGGNTQRARPKSELAREPCRVVSSSYPHEQARPNSGTSSSCPSGAGAEPGLDVGAGLSR